MSTMAPQIASLTIVYSGVDQSSASLAFVRGIHRWPVNSPHKGPVTQKMFPFDDVMMSNTALIMFIDACICHQVLRSSTHYNIGGNNVSLVSIITGSGGGTSLVPQMANVWTGYPLEAR